MATGLYHVNSIRNVNNRILDLAFVSDVCDIEVLEAPSYLLRMDAHHKPFVLRVQIWETRNNSSSDSNDEADFDFSLCDFESLNASLSTINWTNELANKGTDEATAHFYDKLYDVLHSNVPRKRLRPKQKGKLPWWSPELRRLRNGVRKARKRYYRSKSPIARQNLHVIESRYNECKVFTFRNYINTIESNLKNNPNSFWSFVKSRKSNNRIPEQIRFQDRTSANVDESANLFADFFSSLNSTISPTLSTATRHSTPTHDITLSFLNFTEQDVKTALTSLDVKKGAGADRLPPSFWKECAESMVR